MPMNEPVVLRAEQRDLPMLFRLWEDVFGDPPELIEAFFRYFSPEKTGWVVKRGDRLCSAAYLITGNELLRANESLPAGYVYAVATAPEERGKGCAGMLMRHLEQYARKAGILLYTRPASDRLFAWYSEKMGAKRVSRMSETEILPESASSVIPVRRIDPAEYGEIRERYLQGKSHMVLSDPFLLFQENCSDGYFAAGDGAACCMRQGNTLVIPELLCASEQRPQIVQSLIRSFQAERAVLRSQFPDGESPLVAFSGDDLLAETDWGLLLE